MGGAELERMLRHNMRNLNCCYLYLICLFCIGCGVDEDVEMLASGRYPILNGVSDNDPDHAGIVKGGCIVN